MTTSHEDPRLPAFSAWATPEQHYPGITLSPVLCLILESKDLILELADGAGLLEAKALGGLLQAANHGWRATEQDLDVGGRSREPFSDHFGSDIADTALPLLRRLIQDVVDTDVLVLLYQGIQILLEKNILSSNIGEDQIDLCGITLLTAANNSSDDLQHRGDAGTASNHTKVLDHVGLIDESALGTADLDGLTDNERGHVLRDVALRVGLDQEIKVAGLVITGDGGIRADDLLGSAIGLGKRSANGDVLADGKAEDRVAGGQLESVNGDIVGDDGLLLELEFLERVGLQHRLRL
jgi:hypothetical protein